MTELKEMKLRETHKIYSVPSQTCDVLARIPHTASKIIHHSSYKIVLITIRRILDFLVCFAHLVQFFIVEREGHI